MMKQKAEDAGNVKELWLTAPS